MNINKLNQDIMQFTQEDKELLASKHITEEKIAEQLKNFETGFPYLKLEAAASVAKGILVPDDNAVAVYERCWENYKSEGKHILKFVPASGAASRMFKDLFAFVDAEYDVPTTAFEKKFFDEIRNFAFYNLLDEACRRNEGEGVEACVAAGKYKAVVRNLLLASGLNYGSLPKGLLKFHSYEGFVRTPLEEHLVEGALYAKGSTGKVNVHFTVSTEHKDLFAALVAEKKAEYETKYSTEYDITFSEQKPSTDTIAADMDNNPFRDNGKLLFRPGGHGALIENLNDLDYDVIFIGFPNWWGVEPRIIDSFLESYDFSSKTVIPFFTSGGSGKGKIEERISKLCPSSDVRGTMRLTSAMSDTEIESWLNSLCL